MPEGKQDLLSKLADRGEDVVGKLADIPAAQRLLYLGRLPTGPGDERLCLVDGDGPSA